MITDLSSQLPALQALVADFDATPRQVLMEVKTWQVSHSQREHGRHQLGLCAEEAENSLGRQFDLPGVVGIGDRYGQQRHRADLPAISRTAISASWWTRWPRTGKTDIVSLPRIVAVSGEKAQIHVGASEPFVSVSSRENQGDHLVLRDGHAGCRGRETGSNAHHPPERLH